MIKRDPITFRINYVKNELLGSVGKYGWGTGFPFS